MELTSRRFAIFLASGLSLAVIVGVLVWKVSDAGVNLTGQQTEIAGQPVAAADADERSTKKTAVSSETSSTTDRRRDENGESANTDTAGTGNGNNGDTQAGEGFDPLAPRNANLDGARGGSEEISYYRPTNAAPAPQTTRTSAPEQTQQPNSGGYVPAERGEPTRTTVRPNSTTVVPEQPEEPQQPSEGDAEGTSPANTEPQKASEEEENSAGAQVTSEIAEKALNAGQAAVGSRNQDGDSPKRPEDPFSASTRVPLAPAENAGTENGAEANN
ncbi:hypothetical protein [Corynebacterium urinipleomorphum]|uniref:hypothetical protein n=1 Tax=Corynebacterium urinipleomorphum TaxID=1852380 RepID=UPI0011780F34|nr:hypothetical protein [Corynebacterium urinipleomorphum]